MKPLIIYATKTGSTEKAASLLTEKMSEKPKMVNINNINSVNLNEFDTIIIGSSIHIGKISKKLSSFINKNIEELLKKKIAIYLCAGEINAKYFEDNFHEKLIKHSIINDFFGYAYYLEKMNFIERFIVKKMGKIEESKEEYYIDKIQSFAKALQN